MMRLHNRFLFGLLLSFPLLSLAFCFDYVNEKVNSTTTKFNKFEFSAITKSVQAAAYLTAEREGEASVWREQQLRSSWPY